MSVQIVSSARTNEYVGKALDEKPILYVPNGSTFYEFDTQKLYVFDGDTKQWIEQ